MLCNANPRNIKKNTKTKEQWSQREQQRSIRTKKAKINQGHRITPIT